MKPLEMKRRNNDETEDATNEKKTTQWQQPAKQIKQQHGAIQLKIEINGPTILSVRKYGASSNELNGWHIAIRQPAAGEKCNKVARAILANCIDF